MSTYPARTLRLIMRGDGLGLPLTAREAETVLAIMAGRITAKSIASALAVSKSSVDGYLYRIYAKSGADNMAHLVLMMTGVVPCPDNLLPVQRRWRRKHYKLDEI